jgi:transcriptional regulator with XRE-family HTH domain
VAAGHRRCTKCTTPLARDQTGRLCSPCERFGREHVPPSGVWHEASVSEALRSRHFGRVMTAYRQSHDPVMTQAAMGQLLELTQAQVSRIENAVVPPAHLVKLQRWAAALGVPAELLWFAPASRGDGSVTAWNATVPAESQRNGESVERRKFLKVGATAIGATLLAGPAAATTRRVSPGCITDGVRDMTRHFRGLDNRFGGGHSKSVATAYLTTIVEPQLREAGGRAADRKRLLSAAAELQHLVGWMSFDTGQPSDGHRYMRQALKLCQEAGNDALVAEMLAGMSHQATFHGSANSAVDLALAAGHSAKRAGSPALRAEAAVMEAHALALGSDRPGALNALGEAERAFNASDPSNSPEWLSYFDHAYLAAKFGHTFKELGMAAEAELFARRSLDMTDGYDRGRMFNTALLASALADQGKLEESCATAAAAVRMSVAVRSVRGTSYLTDVGRRLAPHRRVHAVADLFDLMADAGLPTP